MSEAVRYDPRQSESLPPILGNSPAMRRAVDLARRFAGSPLPILLVGPTGSGKELMARHIHAWSGRGGPFMDVNCGALPKELVESTLFGHARGAFSGATDARMGLVEAANGGSLFLDELCSMSYDAQSKLLRVLDSQSVRRLGETHNRAVSFRPIAASQDRLGDRTAEGTFRLDLLQRLAGVEIQLPSLPQRREDILPMARAFAADVGKDVDASAEHLLVQHSWPGNVRELRNVIERATWLSPGDLLVACALEEAICIGASSNAVRNLPHRDRGALLAVCEEEKWHASRIAARLGVGRTTLYRRLVALGISLRHHKHFLLR
jgi:two-component system response regulator HydG